MLELSSGHRVARQDKLHGLVGHVSQGLKTGGERACVSPYPILAQGSSKPLGPSDTWNSADGYLWESELGIIFSIDDITLVPTICQLSLWRHWNIIVGTYCQGDFATASQLVTG